MSIHAVGIDLGTTYSAVARIDEHGRTQMIRSGDGDLLTPSVVLFEQNEIIVGREARRARGVAAERLAECVKRDIGRRSCSQPINGEKLPPEVVEACILRKLRTDIAEALGGPFKVVITVPAYFDEPRRQATADAGEMAGLDVLNIVNEPMAAALAFGEQLGYLDDRAAPRDKMTVLVYDLGGGTFDVTLIELSPGELNTLATDGDVQLGGYDWDQRLIDFAAEAYQERYGTDPRSDRSCLSRMLTSVEEAKHTLSARSRASIRIDLAGNQLDVDVTRERFEEMTEDLLERTSYTVRQLLEVAGRSWDDIAQVLLVGGSTRMPMVTRMLERLSSKRPVATVNPDEAVARGAALYCRNVLAARGTSLQQPAFQVVDVNSHSLGIEGIEQETGRKENVTLIRRNSPLPAEVKRKFVTNRESQKSIVVQVLEGESRIPDQCTPIGRAVIRDLPAGLPRGYPISVYYRYLENGRLTVRAKVPGTDREANIELQRDRGLSSDSKVRWRQLLASDVGFSSFEEMVDDAVQGEKLQTSPGAADLASGDGPRASDFAEAATLSAPSAAGNAAGEAEPVAGAAEKGAAATQTAAAPTAADAIAQRRAQNQRKVVRNLIGHVVASTIGLAIGYYIVCMIRPEANFLRLDLPGLQQPADPQPPAPGEAEGTLDGS